LKYIRKLFIFPYKISVIFSLSYQRISKNGGMRMKKYVMLSTFTIVLIAAVLFSGKAMRNSIIPVSIVKVSPLTVENFVTCSGRVERISTRNVYAPSAAIVNHVYVKAGDKVTAGQPLMEIKTPSAKQTNSSDYTDYAEAYAVLLNQYGGQSSSSVAPSEYESVTQTITAPCSGKITSVSVINQSYVQPGYPVAIISDEFDSLQVRLSVNESQIAGIKVGQKAIISGVGFKNTSYSGAVKNISSDAKQITSTTGQETVVEVIVSVDKPGEDIKPGYTAKAKITTSEDANVLIAPYETVRADKDGSEYVFKFNGQRAVKTPVVTSKEFDSGFQVVSGLSQNDQIIANPDTVSDGTHVVPKQKGVVSSYD
jgi:multidrug efflux pump subunit AcrA (membrane-fusion protein)